MNRKLLFMAYFWWPARTRRCGVPCLSVFINVAPPELTIAADKRPIQATKMSIFEKKRKFLPKTWCYEPVRAHWYISENCVDRHGVQIALTHSAGKVKIGLILRNFSPFVSFACLQKLPVWTVKLVVERARRSSTQPALRCCARQELNNLILLVTNLYVSTCKIQAPTLV